MFDLFTKEETPRLLRADNIRKIPPATYSIYPLAELPALVARVRADKPSKDKLTLRFLVDSDYSIWFAEEGPANKRIPAHYQMTGEKNTNAHCIIAGNIKLTADLSTLISLSNKSGDFNPPFNTLQWALAVLVSNKASLPFAFPTELQLKEVGRDTVHLVTPEQLDSWLAASFNQDQIEGFQHQPSTIKTVTYPTSTAGFFPDILQTREEDRAIPRDLQGELFFEDAADSSPHTPQTMEKNPKQPRLGLFNTKPTDNLSQAFPSNRRLFR